MPGGVTLARTVRRVVPRAWVPVALRGLYSSVARLPAPLRHRAQRFFGLSRPDMGDIDRSYGRWIAQYDRIDTPGRAAIEADIERMAHQPLISVLMPVFNPPPDHLLEAIRSVQDQFYTRWELCISDDASTDPAVVSILREASREDPRIKLMRRERNGHISLASNSALQLATGSFVALMDHDDVLPPHALFEVAAQIVINPEVDIIYSDEDHIDHAGQRSHPYFKPDWNPELMLGQNLISHLGVYRRTLVERIGGFRAGLEGSQDYDLALRAVAETRPEQILHIAKVLYHWRQAAGEPTFSEASHDRCVQTGRQAVAEFVGRDHPGATVVAAPVVPGWTRVVYPVPEPEPRVSVIMAPAQTPDALFNCIDRLLDRIDYEVPEILLAPEAVTSLPGGVTSDPRVRLVTGPDVNWQNRAAAEARGGLLLLLDPDLVPNGTAWLRDMVSRAVCPDVGAVGAKLLSSDGLVLHAGAVLCGPDVVFTPFVGRSGTQGGYFGQLQLARDVTSVSGRCLMVDRRLFLDVGGLDDALSSLQAFGDVDLCLKLAQAGYRIIWTPYAELHAPDAAPKPPLRASSSRRAAELMRQRWGSRLNVDRFWNPNLALDATETALAFPPRAQRSDRLPAMLVTGAGPSAVAARTEVLEGAPVTKLDERATV